MDFVSHGSPWWQTGYNTATNLPEKYANHQTNEHTHFYRIREQGGSGRRSFENR